VSAETHFFQRLVKLQSSTIVDFVDLPSALFWLAFLAPKSFFQKFTVVAGLETTEILENIPRQRKTGHNNTGQLLRKYTMVL
jgi:hypothetical protein